METRRAWTWRHSPWRILPLKTDALTWYLRHSSSCWVLKLLSWFDALGGWSRPALAEDNFWFSLFVLGWTNSCCRFRLAFNNCFMVWATTNPNVWAGAAPLLPFAQKENKHTFFNSSRKIRLESGSILHKCVSKNTKASSSKATLVLYPFSMTDDGCHSSNIPALWKFTIKIHYAARSWK